MTWVKNAGISKKKKRAENKILDKKRRNEPLAILASVESE
jgi:hypothetical protein